MTKIRSTDASRIDDRRGQGGGGLGGLGSLGGLGGLGKAGGGLVGLLVVLAAIFLPKLMGGSGGTGDSAADVNDGTCSSELEQVVCGASDSVQVYWAAALPQFFGTQYRDTKTTFFTGSVSTACGQASSQLGPFYCPPDERVYIDLDFMQQLEQRLVGRSTDLAEQYIVAHEYGHHVQNILGTSARVAELEQSNPGEANQYSVMLELQADCYAGAWVGEVAAQGQLDSATEVNEALDAAAGVGDDAIQGANGGTVNPDTFTHGTSAQRQQWFRTGYDSRDPRQCDTFGGRLG